MVSEAELHDELEYTDENDFSAFPDDNGWEIALDVYETIYASDEPMVVAQLADELDVEHAPVRAAVVRAEETGYLSTARIGYELTDTGETEFADLFSDR